MIFRLPFRDYAGAHWFQQKKSSEFCRLYEYSLILAILVPKYFGCVFIRLLSVSDEITKS